MACMRNGREAVPNSRCGHQTSVRRTCTRNSQKDFKERGLLTEQTGHGARSYTYEKLRVMQTMIDDLGMEAI